MVRICFLLSSLYEEYTHTPFFSLRPCLPKRSWPESFSHFKTSSNAIPLNTKGLRLLLAQIGSGLISSLFQVKRWSFSFTFFNFDSCVIFTVTPSLATLSKVVTFPNITYFPFLLDFSCEHLCHLIYSTYVYVYVCMYVWMNVYLVIVSLSPLDSKVHEKWRNFNRNFFLFYSLPNPLGT